VVSVHLSAAMPGTSEAARLAAERAPVPVRVVGVVIATRL
jgi:hypothetical protein